MARNAVFDWEEEGLSQEDFKLKKGQGFPSSRNQFVGSKEWQPKYKETSNCNEKTCENDQVLENRNENLTGRQFQQNQNLRPQPLIHEKNTVQLREGGILAKAEEVEVGGANATLPITKTILPEKERIDQTTVYEIPKNNKFQVPSQKIVNVPTKSIIEVPETQTREIVEKKIIEVPSKKTISVPTTTYVEVPTTKLVPVQSMKQVEVETIKKIEVPVVRTEQVQTTRRVEIPSTKQVLVDSHDVVEINRNAQNVRTETIGDNEVNVLAPGKKAQNQYTQDRNSYGSNQVLQGESIRQTQ